jgi:hypothetical protein
MANNWSEKMIRQTLMGLTIALCVVPLVQAQNALVVRNGVELEQVKTDGGCTVFVNRHQSLAGLKSTIHKWSGKCDAGVASGFGNLETTHIFENTEHRTSITGYLRAGLNIGHFHATSRFGANLNMKIERWQYAYGENLISAPLSLMTLTQAEISGSKVILPKVITALPPMDAPGYTVIGLTKNVSLRQFFSVSGPGSFAVEVYDLPTIPGIQAMQAAMSLRQTFPCPNPTTQTGCDALFFEKAKPVIDEILNFIKATASLVENEIALTNK